MMPRLERQALLLLLVGSVMTLLLGTVLAAPMSDEVRRLVFLQDYNTRLVVFGTTMLGAASGVVGTFLMLRRRALLGDAIAHATLPGVVLMFLLLVALGRDPRSLTLLLSGAAIFGTLGMFTVVAIRRFSKLKDDTALGIVLSVFFGLGICLLGVAQRLDGVSAAGLLSFIYGKTASMLFIDAVLISGMSAFVVAVVACLYKELTLLCFDHDFASTQGWPVLALDMTLMMLVVIATVVGLQSVGLILVVALLVIPPAAARCWTHHLGVLLWISAAIGALSGLLGSLLSAAFADLPAGAIIVLVAAFLFLISFLFGFDGGLVQRQWRRFLHEREVGMQHLLRAVWELTESETSAGRAGVQRRRSWSAKAFQSLVRRAVRQDLLLADDDRLRLTERGQRLAARHVRNHRLWELFLIRHADTAPSRVDRGADLIEHVLNEDLVAELERELDATPQQARVPASPHTMDRP